MNVLDGDPRPEPVDELGAVPRRQVRVHGNESNYRYGIGSGAHRVFRLLDERGLPVTATAAALALERAPDVAARLVAGGHETAAHGYRWVYQYRMEEAEERNFIRRARDSIAATVGVAPVGWLSRLLHTDDTRRLLAEEGFTYHMDDYSGDLPFWERVECADGESRPMLVLPYALDSNDMKMWTAPSLTPANWARYAIDTFDWLLEEADREGARMMSLGLHLRIVGRPGRAGALRRVLDHVNGRDDVWVATRRDIAAAWAAAVPPLGA
ncbi:MAG: polysaccharide deacetylase family protein [Gammaproteobacteria bacterium]|nr:polysaccharide deacetylase family protein [Gammaproteobacteria bacterium]MYK47032.1 polysaccharide deacetylase family protein [Gammaproteobacteria bacterium]